MASNKKNKKRRPATPKKKSPESARDGRNVKQRGVIQRSRRGKYRNAWLWAGIVVALIVAGRISFEIPRLLGKPGEETAVAEAPREAPILDGPGLSLAELQSQQLIINVHEHIQSLEYAPVYLDMMDELGIAKICLMGSSMFTLTLKEKYGFTRYDENNDELLKIVEAYPGRFEAWTVVDPTDPNKFRKFKDCVARGATGLKLYTGHGYVSKKNAFMFHTRAMDDREMLPLYKFCEENFIPVCIHVNPFDNGGDKGKPGFAQELIAVLTQFPDMKVDVPHFMLSSIKSTRLREYLDTFPNVYTDISFGDYFVAAGLKRISKSPDKFRRLFADYPDRIMYATDLVLTVGRNKTRQWVREQFTAYLDMLSKETYTTPILPGKQLRGLALPDALLERVLHKNYEDFVAKRPKGTRITRGIEWSRMGVKPIKRKPGQAFPPRPKRGG